MKTALVASFIATLLLCSCGGTETTETPTEAPAASTPNTSRIVSLSGSISETLSLLGLEENIVGVEITSTYPPSLQQVPKVGHNREIAVEAVMAQNPTLVLGLEGKVKAELVEQLKAANVRVILFGHEYSVEGAKTLITAVADSLGLSDKKEPMLQQLDNDLAGLTLPTSKPKVLFIYARGAGMLMVAGEKTPADAMIKLAGGENAVSGFDEFKPLTPEALLSANPDVILMFGDGLESLGGIDGMLQIQGMKETNAGKNKAVIEMEGQYLTGFGPRTGKAIVELADKFTAVQTATAVN